MAGIQLAELSAFAAARRSRLPTLSALPRKRRRSDFDGSADRPPRSRPIFSVEADVRRMVQEAYGAMGGLDGIVLHVGIFGEVGLDGVSAGAMEQYP